MPLRAAFAAFLLVLALPSPSAASGGDPESRLARLVASADVEESRLAYLRSYVVNYEKVTGGWLRPFRSASEKLADAERLRDELKEKTTQARRQLASLRKAIRTVDWEPVSGPSPRNEAALATLEEEYQRLKGWTDEAAELRVRFTAAVEKGAARVQGGVCAGAGGVLIVASAGTLTPEVLALEASFAPAVVAAGGVFATGTGAAVAYLEGKESPRAPSAPEPSVSEEDAPLEVDLQPPPPQKASGTGKVVADQNSPLGKLASDGPGDGKQGASSDLPDDAEILKEYRNLISKRPARDYSLKAKGRSAQALAAEAKSQLALIAEGKVPDLSRLGQFILDTEALPAPGEKESRLYKIDYERARDLTAKLAAGAQKIAADPALDYIAKVEKILAEVFPHLEKYADGNALLSDCLSGRPCNCDGETRTLASVFMAAAAAVKDVLPPPLRFGIQTMKDHVQFVVGDPTPGKRSVWNLLTGDREERVLGPVLDPALFYRMFLTKQGVTPPVGIDPLLIAEEDPLTEEERRREAKLSFQVPPTNTNLDYGVQSLRHFGDGPPPAFATLAPPGSPRSRDPRRGRVDAGPGRGGEIQFSGDEWHLPLQGSQEWARSAKASLEDPGMFFDRLGELFSFSRPSFVDRRPAISFYRAELVTAFAAIRDPAERVRFLKAVGSEDLSRVARSPEVRDYVAVLNDPRLLTQWSEKRVNAMNLVADKLPDLIASTDRVPEKDFARTEPDLAVRALLAAREDARVRLEKNPKGVLVLASRVNTLGQAYLFSYLFLRGLAEQRSGGEGAYRASSSYQAPEHLKVLARTLGKPGLVALKSPKLARSHQDGQRVPGVEVGATEVLNVPEAFNPDRPDPRPTGVRDEPTRRGARKNGVEGSPFAEAPAKIHLPAGIFGQLFYSFNPKELPDAFGAVRADYVRNMPLSFFTRQVMEWVGSWAEHKRRSPGEWVVNLPLDPSRPKTLSLDLAKAIAQKLRQLIALGKVPASSLRSQDERDARAEVLGGNSKLFILTDPGGHSATFTEALEIFEKAIAHPYREPAPAPSATP